MATEYANNLFVKKGKFGTKISIKADAFIEELNAKKNKDGWVNIEIKETKSGDKLYAVYDTWVPGEKTSAFQKPAQKSYEKPKAEPVRNDDLPF